MVLINFNGYPFWLRGRVCGSDYNENNKNNNVLSLRGLHIKYKMNLSNKWSYVKLNKKEHIYSTWQTLSTNKR